MTTTARLDRVPIRILVIFVLSGAAGLIDEIVWSRQLVLVFGNTTQAVSAILTGFFGGMAIGAWVGGRIADRVRSAAAAVRPARDGPGVVVVLTPITFRLIDEVYRGIYPSLEDAPQALALVRMALAVLALAPATVLMGATLPTLTRYLTGRRSPERGVRQALCREHDRRDRRHARRRDRADRAVRAVGRAGGRCRVLGRRGHRRAVARTGRGRRPASERRGGRRGRGDRGAADVAPARGRGGASGRPDRTRLALGIAFVSGLTSLGYQVLWTRLLASGTGNTTYVFTIILALFLAGLAIGALLFTLIRSRIGDPTRLLAFAQVLVGALVLSAWS